jgi:hypothetical protein
VVSAFSTGTESACDAYVNLFGMSETIHGAAYRCNVLLKRLQKSDLSKTESEPTNLIGPHVTGTPKKAATDKINKPCQKPRTAFSTQAIQTF